MARVVASPLLPPLRWLPLSLLLWSHVVAAQPKLQAAQEALDTGDYAVAERDFRALLQGPDRAYAALGLAALQLQTGRYGEAEATAGSISRVGGPGLRAATLRAEAQWLQGKLDDAEATLRALADDPAAHRARLQLGRLLIERGKRPAARPYLMSLIAAYNEDRLGPDRAAMLTLVAMAAHALRSHEDANDAFNEAAAEDNRRVETQLAWAQLFAEKYDRDNALMGVSSALARNPHHPGARLLLAELMFDHGSDFSAIEAELSRALSVNPKLVGAYVLRASLSLRDMDLQAADRHLDAALAINPHDLPALSTRAAVRFLADDEPGFARATRAVTRLNPHYSDMYRIIARFAEWEHRYPELVQMARKAIAMDAEDPFAHATLAMNLLRMGDERDGLRALHDAWDRDHFNRRVYNMLALYEDVIEPHYGQWSAPPFTVRTHREEQAVLQPYLAPMLKQAMESMGAHYDFTPEGPLRLELYATEKDFAVRTSGLPNLGVQGVCFGKVVTAVSPRAGEFNWGQIVWHELAHIFHLQMSKSHVPRWFTEGLAEYETTLARPDWRREQDYAVWLALQAGTLPHLRGMNAAFTRAEGPSALMTAYYTASLAAAHIVQRHGFARVREMLLAWGRGVHTDEVFSRVLGQDLDAVDADFRAALAQRLARYDGEFVVDTAAHRDLPALRARLQAAPDDVEAHAALAMGLLLAGQREAAIAAARQALARDPHHAKAHFVMALYATGRGKHRWAQRCLRGIVESGHDGFDLRLMLAQNALDVGDADAALRHIEVALSHDPDGIKAYRSLLKVAEARDDPQLGLRALRGVVRLDQHDRLSHVALMAVLASRRDWAALAALGEQTIFVDPASPEVHYLLGRAQLELGDPGQALTELQRALSLGHRRPGKVHLQRAEALLRLGQQRAAVEAAEAAVEAEPKLAGRAAAVLQAAGAAGK